MPNPQGMLNTADLREWAASFASVVGYDQSRGAEVEAAANQYWLEHYDAIAQGAETLDSAYALPYYWEYVCACFCQHSLFSASRAAWWLNSADGFDPRRILVLADGIGSASWFFAKWFPNAEIYTQILGDDVMRQKAQLIMEDCQDRPGGALNVFYDFAVPNGINPDVIVALEFFEHLTDPFFYVDGLPKAEVLFHRSPFNVMVHGHFKQYKQGERVIPTQDMGREFGKHLKKLGYRKAFHFYNCVPAVFRAVH